MESFFSALWAKIAAVVAWFGSLFVKVFVAVWDVVKDGFSWAFESAISLATSIVGSLDVSALSGAAQAVGTFPANVMQVLSAIGFDVALGVIAAALLIRFTLQLIPFVRLGS